MNKQRLKINFVISTTLAVIFGTAMTSTNSVWGANIDCPNFVPNPNTPTNCFGTNGDDRMAGTANEDIMVGLHGDDTMFGFAKDDSMEGDEDDDTMSGGSGNDLMRGDTGSFADPGNDKMNGESGDDTIAGEAGADILKGSSGNDRIFHSLQDAFEHADGSKDSIDCGSGNDEAWINVNTDHDTAINCETVHAG